MSQDDTRPTVNVTTSRNMTRDQIMISLRLPEIRAVQMVHGTDPAPLVIEETIKAMKNTLDQKFYGDARCATQAMRLLINSNLGFGAHQELTSALRTIEEKLQLRTNLEITQV